MAAFKVYVSGGHGAGCNCPECGGRLRVTKTTISSDQLHRFRYRRCLACGHLPPKQVVPIEFAPPRS